MLGENGVILSRKEIENLCAVGRSCWGWLCDSLLARVKIPKQGNFVTGMPLGGGEVYKYGGSPILFGFGQSEPATRPLGITNQNPFYIHSNLLFEIYHTSPWNY